VTSTGARAVSPATVSPVAHPTAKDNKPETALTVSGASVTIPQLSVQNAAHESPSTPQKIVATAPDAPQTEGSTQEQIAAATGTAPAAGATSIAAPTAGPAAASTAAHPEAKDDKSQTSSTAPAHAGTAEVQPMPMLPVPSSTITVAGIMPQVATAPVDQTAGRTATATETRAVAEPAPAPLPAKTISESGARPADAANAAQAETQTSDTGDTVNGKSGSSASATGFIVAQGATTATAFAAAMIIPAPSTAADLPVNPTPSTTSSTAKMADAGAAATSSSASSAGTIAGTAKSSTGNAATATVTTPAASGAHTQGDPGATSTAEAKPVEAAASIATAASSAMQHAAATSAATPQSAMKAGGEAPHASELPRAVSGAPEASETAAVSGINTAKVIQSMGETEMHVGLRSAEFGEISIRTAVSQQQMLAQISVDHSDLGSTIAAHLPAMQAKLGSEYGLHASVEVTQGSTSFTGNGNQSAPQQQKSFAQAAAVEHAATNSEIDNQPLRVPADGAQRLDIQA
jgi:hypothetical protein